MLTKEILKADKALEGLSDAQLAVIETLSRNDEERVIEKKIGENTATTLTRFDEIIETVTGKKKPVNTKTHDYVESVLKELKTASDGDVPGLKSQIEQLRSDKANLEKQLRDGAGDVALKKQVTDLEQQIRDKESELKQTKEQYQSETTDLQKKLNDEIARATNLEFNSSVNSHLIAEGIKFKDTIPETTREEIMGIRREKLLAKIKPDWIDDGKGGKRQVFRDEKGEIMRNPENKLEPYTAGELYLKEIQDLVDAGKKQTGTGGQPGGGSGSSNTSLDISTAPTQVKADEMISAHILKVEGIAITDPRHEERHQELRTELKVADLPVRVAVEQ